MGLEEDWKDIRPRRAARKAAPPVEPDPGLEDDWARLRGLPEFVYFLDYRAFTPETNRPLPLPQLWRFHVTGRSGLYFQGHQDKLLWTMTDHFHVTSAQQVLVEETFATVEAAKAGLREVHAKVIRECEAAIEDAERKITEWQQSIRNIRRGIALIDAINLDIKE